MKSGTVVIRYLGHARAAIGGPPEHRDHRGPGLQPVIEHDARIEAFVTVDAGTRRTTYVGHRTWLMKHVHVGHDALIGDDCELAPHVSVGGHVMIGDRVRVGQGAIFKPGVTVGDDARIGMGAVVVDDVPAGEVWVGNPARKMGVARIEREAQDAAILNLRRDLDRLRSDLAAGELLEPGMGEFWREKNRALEQLLIASRDLIGVSLRNRNETLSPTIVYDLAQAVRAVDAVQAPACRPGDHA
jgi:acetyltransferase-like isoleucine patch superfamily enzyme